jgi:hypothetical protein
MRRVAFIWIGGLSTLIAVVAAASQAASGAKIDPAADRVLQRMARYLQSQRHFSFSATEQHDVVRESGQKFKYSNSRRATIRRPNRIYSETHGDTMHRRFWYDGKSVTVLDTERNLYASAPAPSSIDATMDHLSRTYRLHVPLADLVFSDPYRMLTEKVRSGAYLGVHSVDRFKTHHLAFTQEDLDWQIWVDTGTRPVPRRIVITYKAQPGQPEYQATLSNWSVGKPVSDATFRFRRPKGATRIEIVPAGKQPRNVRKVER